MYVFCRNQWLVAPKGAARTLPVDMEVEMSAVEALPAESVHDGGAAVAVEAQIAALRPSSHGTAAASRAPPLRSARQPTIRADPRPVTERLRSYSRTCADRSRWVRRSLATSLRPWHRLGPTSKKIRKKCIFSSPPCCTPGESPSPPRCFAASRP